MNEVDFCGENILLGKAEKNYDYEEINYMENEYCH
jgi:hypothetical protein